MFSHLRYFMLAFILTSLSGCSGSTQSAAGGTAGKLSFGDEVSSDIRITVCKKLAGKFQTIGFGNTAPDGSFVLYKHGANEPLWLEPGDYSFTLESVGPPVEFPVAYVDPETSPLRVAWTSELQTLELNAPEELMTQ